MMLAKKENVTWGSTSFYHYLRQRFPEDFATTRRRFEEKAAAEQKLKQAKAKGKPRLNQSVSLEHEESHHSPEAKAPPAQRPKPARPRGRPRKHRSNSLEREHSHLSPQEMASPAQQQKQARPRGRPRKYPIESFEQETSRLTLEDKMDITPVAPKMSTPSTAPKKDANWWEAKVVWELLQKVSSQGLISDDDLTISNLASILTRKYTVDDPHVAAIYIRSHASNLLYMMSGTNGIGEARGVASGEVGGDFQRRGRVLVDAVFWSSKSEAWVKSSTSNSLATRLCDVSCGSSTLFRFVGEASETISESSESPTCSSLLRPE